MSLRISKRLPQELHQHIAALESDGWKLRLKHWRDVVENPVNVDSSYVVAGFVDNRPVQITEFEVRRKDKEDGPVFVADAVCAPDDAFDRAKGTKLAIERVLHQMSKALGRNELHRILDKGVQVQ